MDQMPEEQRQQAKLMHPSGVEFTVNLTPYEIQRAREDTDFYDELIEKYYNLYRNNLIFGEIVEPSVEPDMQPTRKLREDDEEHLISLVAERPALFDLRLPLRERSRETVTRLWEEIISELNVNITVKEVSAKWKNIRDSYLRARSNVKKRLASGSSAEDKLRAEAIKEKHRNYELLQFLDGTLAARRTVSNIEETGPSSASPVSSPTPTPVATPVGTPVAVPAPARGVKRRTGSSGLTTGDEAFLSSMEEICKTTATAGQSLTATQNFCMRLADSLDRLPRNVRNQLEIEFLTKVAEAEENYSQL